MYVSDYSYSYVGKYAIIAVSWLFGLSARI